MNIQFLKTLFIPLLIGMISVFAINDAVNKPLEASNQDNICETITGDTYLKTVIKSSRSSVRADRELPIGIPTPTFGWNFDSNVSPTIYVDNTNPNCSNSDGSAARPLCDLFKGQRTVTFNAGDVVEISGGPYDIPNNAVINLNGTTNNPVIIKGIGQILYDGRGNRREITWRGQYAIIENLKFFHKSRHVIQADYIAFRNIEVSNPVNAFIDFNPVVSIFGHDVLIQDSKVYNNIRNNDKDSHAFQASSGSHHVWILYNETYNNNGDSFQACHKCNTNPPHHVYIGGNKMHNDRENAVDLKSVRDVVVSQNVFYGYQSSTTSNGDACVVGSTGFNDATNEGPRNIYFLYNEFRDSTTGLRCEGTQDVWLIGNIFKDLDVGVQIDAKEHRIISITSNTFTRINNVGIRAWGCEPDNLSVTNNLFKDVGGRQVDLTGCDPSVLTVNNNFVEGNFSMRFDGTRYDSANELNQDPFAKDNLEGDAKLNVNLMPLDGSPVIDAGALLANIYNKFRADFGEDIAKDFTGTPRPSGVAEDIGTFEFNDGTPPNGSPIARNDTSTVDQDSRDNIINVLRNDDFGSDGPSSGAITLISNPSNGIATVDTNGTSGPTDDTIKYTPLIAYSGPDSFSYEITDSNGDKSSATVTITIDATPVNDMPIAQDDNFTIQKDSNDNILNVVSNDNFGDNGAKPGAIVIVNPPANGTATVNTNGTSNPEDDTIKYSPNTGYIGTDNLTYEITDKDGDKDQANVTIEVSVNPQPNIEVSDVKIKIQNATCPNVANGSFEMSIDQNVSYNFNLTVTGSSLSTPIRTTTDKNTPFSLEKLAKNTYQVCLFIDSFPDYKQCYEIAIVAYEDLVVKAQGIKNEDKTASYQVAGSTFYEVKVNEGLYSFEFETTTPVSIQIPLKSGPNKIQIVGTSDCQGVFKDTIVFNAIKAYPTLVTNQMYIEGLSSTEPATIKVFNLSGVLAKEVNLLADNGKVKLNFNNLPNGLYFISLKTNHQTFNVKAIKK
ncbi:Ig-like domain-containing protein [Aquimarina megaterium]|uniref:Ig-like domain-containing protein n=1 Tax=Aquimarina megaterium TaxID=1443666 RepID=UPI0009448D30|nr:Ig-like domain-containing protein [Aquimarina megaterium]